MDTRGRGAQIRGWVTLALLASLVIAALISPVGAALNKNKVKNIATKTVNNLTYTESEADARFINTGDKASDAELLDGVDSGAFIQPQGRVLVSTGHRSWVSQSLGVTASYSTNSTAFLTPGAGTDQFIGTSPDIPISLYGRSLQLQGAEFCYSNSPSTTLDSVFLIVYTNSADGFPGDEAVFFEDETNRTDNACRLYTLPTPLTLSGEHMVSFTARVDYAAASSFTVARTTFVLEPTTTATAPLARLGPEVVLSPAKSDDGSVKP